MFLLKNYNKNIKHNINIINILYLTSDTDIISNFI